MVELFIFCFFIFDDFLWFDNFGECGILVYNIGVNLVDDLNNVVRCCGNFEGVCGLNVVMVYNFFVDEYGIELEECFYIDEMEVVNLLKFDYDEIVFDIYVVIFCS